MRRLAITIVLLLLVACGSSGEVTEPVAPAAAGAPPVPTATVEFGDRFPEVIAVEATDLGDGRWRFDVTLSSPYDTPQRYADAWRVLDSTSTELGVRVLLHDHASEQPFTRSETIDVPEGTSVVHVEGRDQVNGWSGQRFEFRLPSS